MQFHGNFQLIFSLHFSENAQKVHFREAKFQNFLRTQKDVSFLSRKGCTPRIVQIYILRTADTSPLKLKVHPPPPPKKLRTRLLQTMKGLTSRS